MKIIRALLYSLFYLTCLIWSSSLFGKTCPQLYQTTPNVAVTIPMGTVVSLALNQEVTAEQVEVGQTVNLVVMQDVVIKGSTLIRTGLRAEGIVKEVVKPCYGYCGFHQSKLVIALSNVQAVDGQKVYLSGPTLLVKGDGYRHTPAIARQHQLMTGYVRAEANISF